jgi:hypothetical protein
MDEILKITEKYDEAFIKEGLGSVEALNKFALTFYKDVAEIYDCITRIRNIERNPRGFSLNDAPILGLLVRVWKLLKEVIYYYGENNAEIIGILERPLIEAAVVAQYLMTSDQSIVEDYRKCSYKDRLRLLRNLQTGSAIYDTKAIEAFPLNFPVVLLLDLEFLQSEFFEFHLCPHRLDESLPYCRQC